MKKQKTKQKKRVVWVVWDLVLKDAMNAFLTRSVARAWCDYAYVGHEVQIIKFVEAGKDGN